ncbi:MAG: DUF1178 family protein [Alphaproteobacteria bacterium]|nr:DUF1178 family protein [Alphaproteobacteria bacterium]
MIVFDLKCKNGHAFEAWFASGAAFERQSKAGVITCPHCGTSKVNKAPMAPNLNTNRRQGGRPSEGPAMATKGDYERPADVQRALTELRQQIEKNCKYVGERFAEEARKIHYGEVKPHNIYGQTTPQEAKDLTDEGVDFGILPWSSRTNS